jgi:hypothetical protein
MFHSHRVPNILSFLKILIEFSEYLSKIQILLQNGTGIWTQGFAFAKLAFYLSWATPSFHFALVILEMESCELFTQADFESKSPWFQPPKVARITGVSHRHQLCFFKKSFNSLIPLLRFKKKMGLISLWLKHI